MNNTSPTHEQVTQRAQEIWLAYGSPGGRDTEIWLEAERQLNSSGSSKSTSEPSASQRTRGSGTSEAQNGTAAVADPVPANLTPHPTPAESAAKSALQKKEARAPKTPGKSAPKAMPPESGKPLWDKPHSS